MISRRTLRRIIARWQAWRAERKRPEVLAARERIAAARRRHAATASHFNTLRKATHKRLAAEIGRTA